MNAEGEFPVTREMIDKLDGWVKRLSGPLLPAEKVVSEGKAEWKFREETPLVLLIAKAVRIASGIRAAMTLADAGFVAECACLLRVVGDLAVEVIAVAEGELRGDRTKAQQDFIDQYFSRPTVQSAMSSSPPKQDFVGRKDLVKAHVRLAEIAGQAKEEYRDLLGMVSWGLDGYVHGSYPTAMELYHPGRHEFMVRGHEGEQRRRVYRTAVNAKVVEVLNAFRFVAIVGRDEALSVELGEAALRLMQSDDRAVPSR